jgi:hypothetical protein
VCAVGEGGGVGAEGGEAAVHCCTTVACVSVMPAQCLQQVFPSLLERLPPGQPSRLHSANRS